MKNNWTSWNLRYSRTRFASSRQNPAGKALNEASESMQEQWFSAGFHSGS